MTVDFKGEMAEKWGKERRAEDWARPKIVGWIKMGCDSLSSSCVLTNNGH